MERRYGERWVWVGLGAVVIVVAAVGLLSMLRPGGSEPSPPVMSRLPDFQLVERSGEVVTRADLAGRPWVADFIFTQCSGMCPALSARMAELRRQLRERGLAARTVSISVDPTRDTPEVLREYARRYNADGTDWLFVTGERDALYELIGKGFRLSVAERSSEQARDGGELITHSDRFVLIDGEGYIRGYYHGLDADVLPGLLRDLAQLKPEP